MTNRDVVATNPIVKRFAEPVSWVGPGRKPGEICLGFETGQLLFTDLALEPTSDLTPVFGSGEAINGAVFFEDNFALTTRGAIHIGTDPFNPSSQGRFSRGAHGIVGNGRGTMVAPLATEGLWCLQWPSQGHFTRRTIRMEGGEPYIYQTVHLGCDERGFDLFASACRSDGLILTSFGPSHTPSTSRLIAPDVIDLAHPFDIVSVCSLNDTDSPSAVALLAMDGTIYFAPDLRRGQFARMLTKHTHETPYSIHCAQGHIFIHASAGITAIQDVARRILANDLPDDRPRTLRLATDAVDCAVIEDQFLIVIEAEQVSLTSIPQLFPTPSHRLSDGSGAMEPPSEPDVTTDEWSPDFSYLVNRESLEFADSQR